MSSGWVRVREVYPLESAMFSMDQYRAMHNCFYSAIDILRPEVHRECEERTNRAVSLSTEIIKAGVRRGNVDDILEYGIRKVYFLMILFRPKSLIYFDIRLCSGVHVNKNVNQGLKLFIKIGEGNYPREKRASAYSMACFVHHCRVELENDTSGAILACEYANKSAELGLFSPTCLNLANGWDNLGIGTKMGSGGSLGWLSAFWKSYEQYHQQTLFTQSHKPISCSACGQPSKKSSLKKCGGRCETERKPLYCCRDCQVMDWPRHKKYCTK